MASVARTAIVLAVVACAAPRRDPSPPTPSPAPAATPVEPRPAEAARPAFRYAAGTFAYRVTSDATIELRGDTLPAEGVQTSTYVTYTFAPGDGATTVNGLVDSFTVRGSGPAGRVPTDAPMAGSDRGSIFPISFTARLDHAQQRVEFPPLTVPDCSSPAGSLLATARDLLVALPSVLARGATWRDTSTAVVCQGDVPLTATRLRTHTVEGGDTFAGVPAVRVRRASTLTLSGERQGRRAMSLAGTGSATQLLYFDPATGRFLGATGESAADIQLTARDESAAVVQRVRQRVELVSP